MNKNRLDKGQKLNQDKDPLFIVENTRWPLCSFTLSRPYLLVFWIMFLVVFYWHR